MKTGLLILLTILFFSNTYGQLQADAGPDQGICHDSFVIYPVVTLGGTSTASGGTLPYTYSWHPERS